MRVGVIYYLITNILKGPQKKFKDLTNIIIPFFKKCSIIGVKALDFADFCEAAELASPVQPPLLKKG